MTLLTSAVLGMGSVSMVMAAVGGEVHHSILRVLHLIYPFENVLPQPAKQPDLLLNTLFAFGVLAVFVFMTARSLRSMPESQGQNILEFAVESLTEFFVDIMGEQGRKYVPFIASYFFYILFLNFLGLIPGFQSPTADLNTTLSFAIIGVIMVNIFAIREVGLLSYLKHFAGEPWWLSWLMFPLHVMGEFAKVVSLAVRLYGNMFAKETLLVVLMGFSPVFILGHLEVPFVPFQLPIMLFGVFVGFLQAMIFALLVSIYLGQFLEGHEHEDGQH